MTLDFEASSKADAERKATKAGMEVQHAQVVSDSDATPAHERHTHRGEDGGDSGRFIKLLVVVVIVAVAVFFFWAKIRGFLRR
jgi:hypothetical protein